MSNPNLYGQSDVEHFIFAHDLQDIFAEFGVNGVRRQNFFISNQLHSDEVCLLSDRGGLERLEPTNLKQKENAALIQHGFLMGYIDAEKSLPSQSERSYSQFCLKILKAEYIWLQKFFRWIHAYLDQRISEGRSLTQHDAMRISLAAVIEGLHLIEILLPQGKLKPLATLIEETTKKLADCAGGRSFAGGNILEFYWLCCLLNQFLLGELK